MVGGQGRAYDMMTSLRHARLVGLLKQGTSSGAASRDATTIPAADTMPKRPLGPVIVPCQFSRNGRWIGRIRHKYRESRAVKPHTNCVSLNMQGLNWRLMANTHKLRALVQQARDMQWSMVMLADLHFCAEDWEGENFSRPQVVYVEEFVLIQWYRVGFLLDCTLREKWEAAGRPLQHYGQRTLFIQLQVGGSTYHFGSVYAPVQSERLMRRHFFEELSEALRDRPRKHVLIGGDWNGHVGNDTVQHGLSTPTTSGGRDVLQFLELHAFLKTLDHEKVCKNRATWRHAVARKWYELDYFMGSWDLLRMLQKIRVQPFPFSDHRAKVGCFHLVVNPNRQQTARRFRQSSRIDPGPQLDLAAMRGPSTEARNIRARMRHTMEIALQPLLTGIHLQANDQHDTLYVFVDGSCLDKPTSRHVRAGWGVWIPELALSFHGPICTAANAGMFLGADRGTNNTGELSAMIMALMWCWSNRSSGNVVLVYDSTYAASCTQGLWMPRLNQQLATLAQRWLQQCQHKFHVGFRHVRSHTGEEDWFSINNEKVDEAAKQGARGFTNFFAAAEELIREPPMSEDLPTQPWSVLSELCTRVMADCLPTSKPHQRSVPYSPTALQELDRRRDHLLELQTLFQQSRGTELEQSRYQEVRAYKKATLQWARRQRVQWINQLCRRLDAAMRLHDMGQFHHLLKQLGVNISGRSFQGAAPFGLEEITKFVESVGNEDFTPPADLDAMLPPQADIAWEYDTCPSETEVLAALGKMSDTKGGKDGITVGCIRAMGPWYQRLVAKAIQQLWQSPPDSWDATLHDVVGVLLFKKGSRSDLANYRCIQLINIISRLLAKVVDGRIQRFSEQRGLLPNQQYGFRRNRSTIGPIMLVRAVAEIFRSYPNDHHPLLLLIDIRKAYPRVPRSLAWTLFSRLGCPPSLLRVLRGLHDKAIYMVKTQAGYGRTYTNTRGCREGCPSSPACYNLYHSFPMQQFENERQDRRGQAPIRGGLQVGARMDRVKCPRKVGQQDITVELDNVLFADDTTIFTTVEQHREDEQHLGRVLEAWGEDLHPDKTERLPMGMSLEEAAQLAGVPPQSLQASARFLGAWITHDASQRVDTEKRISRAKLLWNKLWKQLQRLNLPAHTMGRLFESTVMATMLYSAESRGFTKKEVKSMQIFVNRCVLGLLNVRQREMHDNRLAFTNLWRKLRIPSVAVAIGVRQLRWLGHLARLPDTRLEKQVLWLWLEGRGPQSGRRKRMAGTIDVTRGLWSRLADMQQTLRLPSQGWERLWTDRAIKDGGVAWRKDIRAWQAAKEKAEDEDLWETRHAPGGRSETQAQDRAQRRAQLAGLAQAEDGSFLCPHCQEPFAANRIWMHARSCALLTPARREHAKDARARRAQRNRALHAPFPAPPLWQQEPPAQAPVPGPVLRRVRGKQTPPAIPVGPQTQVPAPPPAVAARPARAAPKAVVKAKAALDALPKLAPRRVGISDLPAWWERDPQLPARVCQWCRHPVAKGSVMNHEKLCRKMPYNVWLRGIRLLREGLQSDHKCKQCGTMFLEARGCARHAHECRIRRLAEGLPVDTQTFHVLPPATVVQVVRGFRAQHQRSEELNTSAAQARAKYHSIVAANPDHVVSQAVIDDSCFDAETGQFCPSCRKCQRCKEHKCWGSCGRCKSCRRCSRALLADSLTYMVD